MEKKINDVTLQHLHDSLLLQKEISLSLLREDLIHPLTGGNKWRKLKYNLQVAKAEGYDTLLTFGGAYSNHLVATAVAGKQNGFKTIGLVRGEEMFPLNRSLQIVVDHDMQLQYVSREEYRNYRVATTRKQLKTQFGNCYVLPEGGSNSLAVKGCSEIMQHIPFDADIICVATATGSTLAGIASALKPHQQAIGFCVLKNAFQVKYDVDNWLDELQMQNSNYSLIEDYDFGGYAKSNAELVNFIKQFTLQHNITIEPIYTGKLFYGLFDLIRKDFFKRGTRIVAIHTGGLQYLEV